MLKVRIEKKLREAFSPSLLIVKDESYLHIHHGNYQPGGGSHFEVTIVSSVFRGWSRIKRHQQVYACLDKELKNGVHALCLKVLCPEEAALLALV